MKKSEINKAGQLKQKDRKELTKDELEQIQGGGGVGGTIGGTIGGTLVDSVAGGSTLKNSL
jgi:lactobin A/cerein 7B family class IIb bacteriocin